LREVFLGKKKWQLTFNALIEWIFGDLICNEKSFIQ